MKTLNSIDFSSIGNKDRIRKIIVDELNLNYQEVKRYFFYPDPLDIEKKINSFVVAKPKEALQIFNLSKTGLGLGEILLYFLCDGLTLSGFKSQIDAYVDSVPFAEIKAVKYLGKGKFGDIRFGASSSEANLIFLKDIKDLVEHSSKPSIIDSELEISRKQMNELRKIKNAYIEGSLNLKITVNGNIRSKNRYVCSIDDIDFEQQIRQLMLNDTVKNPTTYYEIEDKYISEILKMNIGTENFLCFDRSSARCIFFGKLTKNMLSIDRVTQGRIKPCLDLTPTV